jgi:hypothetical protein
MLTRPAFLIALFLSLLLALTSVTAGAARGAAPVAGWVMLCAGDDAIFVPVDSDGRPTRVHQCPDCTAALVALPPAGPPGTAAPMRYRRATPAVPAATLAHAAPTAVVARGPPHRV